MSNLEVLGLDDASEKIYQILLVSGQLSTGELRASAKISGDQLDSTLSTLLDKKLIRKIPGLERRYGCLLPLGSVKDELETSIAEISTLSSSLKESSNQAVSTIKTEFEASSEQFKNQLIQQEENLVKQISDVDSQISGKITLINSSLNKKVNDLKTNQQDQSTQLQTQAAEMVSSQTANAINAINTRLNSIEDNLNKGKEEQSLSKTEMINNIPSLDVSPIDAVMADVHGLANGMDIKFKESINTLQNSSNDAITELQQSLTSSNSEIQNTANQIVSQTSEATNNFANLTSTNHSKQLEQMEKMNEFVNSSKQQSSVKISEMQAAIHSIYEKQTGSVLQTKDSFTQVNEMGPFSEKADELQADLQSLIADGHSKANSAIDTIKNTFESSMQTETTALMSSVDSLLQQIKSDADAKIIALQTSLRENLGAISASLVEQQNVQKTSFDQSLQEKISTLKSSFNETVSQRDQQFDELLSNLSSTIGLSRTQVDESILGITSSLEQLSNSIKSTTGEMTTNLVNIQGNVDGQIEELRTANQDSLQAGITSAFSQIGTLLDEKVTLLKNLNSSNATNIQEGLVTSTRELTENVSQKVEGLRNSVVTTYDQAKQSLIATVESFHGQYEELLNKSRTSIVGSVKQVERDTEALKENLINSISQTLETINQQIDSATQGLLNDTSEVMDYLQTEASSLNSTVKGTVSTSLNEVRNLSSSGVDQQVAVAHNTLNQFQNTYDSTSSRLIDKTMALAKVLGSLFSVQEATDTPMIKTTSIIGRVPILSFMSDVIGRVKSKITILVPEVDMIHDELILGMKSTAQVTIVSNIDEVTHDKWIEKMHKANANVTLRAITKSGFGGEMDKFIGCEREGEEILVGTIDEGNDDYVAIASASEYFVKLFGGTIISEYSRGRSQQLKRKS